MESRINAMLAPKPCSHRKLVSSVDHTLPGNSITAAMSSATILRSVTFRPNVNIQHKRVSQTKRVGRTQLGVHAVTNWQLEPKKQGNSKGQFVDLTESIADKATATVKSGGGDFVSIFCC